MNSTTAATETEAPEPIPTRVIDKSVPRFSMIPHALLDQFGAALGPINIAVYLALKRFADSDGANCFPSRERVAKLIGASDSSVKRAYKSLLEIGLISVEKRFDRRGLQTSNDIILLPLQSVRTLGLCDPAVVLTDPAVVLTDPRPIRKETETQGVIPNGITGVKTPVSKSAAQKKTTAEKNRQRLALWEAVLNGLGITPRGAIDEAMRGPAFRAMTSALLADSKINPATMTALSRWARGFYAWKGTPPSIPELIKAMPEWERLGRPREFVAQLKPGERPQLTALPMSDHEKNIAHLARIRDRSLWTPRDKRFYTSPGGEQELARDIRSLEKRISEGEQPS